MHFAKTSAPSAIGLLLRLARRAAVAGAVALFLTMVALPAFADDDAKPSPPTPEAQAAAARTTAVALALIAGVGVYYLVQRHRLINGDQRPPEWGAKMNRNAILFAVIAAVGVGGATAALNRPQPRPASHPPAPDIEMMRVNPNYGKPPKPEPPKTGAVSKKTDSDKPHK